MSDAIKCRCRRYFRSSDSECWSIEHDEGEGFVSEDGVISVDKDVVITKDNITDDDEATQRLINILNG
jgi:hypothetical protein